MSGHPGDLLSAWLDGELTPEEVASVASHLNACSACAAERDEVEAGRTAIRALPPLEPPPGLLRAVPAVHLADLISARLDSEVDVDLLPGIDLHLAACPACAAEHDEVAWVRATVRGLPPLEPPADVLHPRWTPTEISAPRPARQGERPRQLLVAAAAVVAAGAGMLGLMGRTPPSDTAPTVASLASSAALVSSSSSSPGGQVVTWTHRGAAATPAGLLSGPSSAAEPVSPDIPARLRQASRHIIRNLV